MGDTEFLIDEVVDKFRFMEENERVLQDGGPRGSGTIAMNGAAAHLIRKGEQIIIMGFELAESPIQPTIVLVDSSNRVVRALTEQAGVEASM